MKSVSSDAVVELKTVGFALTTKCNFYCAHCITNSSPAINDSISLNDAYILIEQIAKESNNICFTGGECFLRLNDLYSCISKANQLKLNISIVTNGFWAKNEHRAREIICELKKLKVSGICVSLDKFHLPFTVLDNALLIAKLCKEHNINSLVRVCSTKNDSFADELINREKHSDINFQRIRVLRMGRATNLPLSDFNFISTLPEDCCTTVRSPIVLPNGMVQACCGPGVCFENHNPLNLGNWKEEKLSHILRKHKTHPIVMALHNFGPKYLFEMLESEFPNSKLPKRENYTGICELCVDLCNRIIFLKRQT